MTPVYSRCAPLLLITLYLWAFVTLLKTSENKVRNEAFAHHDQMLNCSLFLNPIKIAIFLVLIYSSIHQILSLWTTLKMHIEEPLISTCLAFVLHLSLSQLCFCLCFISHLFSDPGIQVTCFYLFLLYVVSLIIIKSLPR